MGKPATAEAIRLSAEGTWFEGGEEITHARTVEHFFKSIARHDGKFVLTGDKAPVPVIVEDTAYFVRALTRSGDSWKLTLSDGSQEELDPATLDIGTANQLYCRVKGGSLSARFDRKVYYEVMKSLDKLDGFYGLRHGDRFYPLGRDLPTTAVQPASTPMSRSHQPEPRALKPLQGSVGKVALRPARRKTAAQPARKMPTAKSVKKSASRRSAKKTTAVRKQPSVKKSRRKGRR